MVITASKVTFLASHKKGNFFKIGIASPLYNIVLILDSLKASHDGLEVVTIGREKENGRSSAQFESLFSLMKESGIEGQKLKIGILQKDKNEGPMIQEWSSFFASKSELYEAVDVASVISTLLASKDSQELVIYFPSNIFKYYLIRK